MAIKSLCITATIHHLNFLLNFYPEKDLSLQANLKNTSERLIKNIIDLRKKSYIVQEKVEHEIKVLKCFYIYKFIHNY